MSRPSAAELLWNHHGRFHPEDVSFLGDWRMAEFLEQPGSGRAAQELASLRQCLAALDELPATPADALDADAVRRVSRFHQRYLEQDLDACNLELLALPGAALQHLALHARSQVRSDVLLRALGQRCLAVPAFLDAQTDNLRRGVQHGRPIDREVAEHFARRLLPGAAAACDALAPLAKASRKAAQAYRQVAQVLAEEIVPHARGLVRLGEAEVTFRLREVMGLERTPAQLLAFAREELRRAQEDFLAQCRRAGSAATSYPECREHLMALWKPRLGSLAEVLAAIRGYLEEATRLVAERALLPIPERLALALEPIPEGLADGSSLINWPAPLLDPAGRGQVLYSRDPAAHVAISLRNLAVHEGIPGHYLQSACWQQGPAREHPVRFLGVADEVAFSRGYFGAMVNVEGWAVHMEQRLRAEGFYREGPEQQFFAWCDVLRATRVILDLELQAGDSTLEALAGLVAEATLMPLPWAQTQVLRARRLPLQGLTYLVGADEIAALRRRHPEPSWLEFHRVLLSAGPVPPARLDGVFRSGPG